MDGPIIINADDNKIEHIDDDDDKGIIAVDDTTHRYDNGGAPQIASDSDHSADRFEAGADTNDDDEESDDDVSIDEIKSVQEDNVNDDALPDSDDDSIPGLRRSKCRNKGKTDRYDKYGLLMAAKRQARGGERRAFTKEGVMFFSGDCLSDAKPIPVEDQME